MANPTETLTYGVDVSRAYLDIAESDTQLQRIQNTPDAIATWLDSVESTVRIAVEATGAYYEELLDQALARDLAVYVISGKQLHHYREAVGPRAKTDADDAQLLRRYLLREHTQLSPVKPLNNNQKKLWRMLKRRAALVKARTQLRASLKGDGETERLCDSVVGEINQGIRTLERLMYTLAREAGWETCIRQCRSIPGIGPLNALALVACFHRGSFARSDQFIAFLGLDVRVRDSGQMKGKRKLTKRGEPELRRLLYNAAMSFCRNPEYVGTYERLRARGMSSTAAYVAVSRKLARIAFALMQRGETFKPELMTGACVRT